MVECGFVYAFTKPEHMKRMEKAKKQKEKAAQETVFIFFAKDENGQTKQNKLKRNDFYLWLNDHGYNAIIGSIREDH
jgi:hypothetical protein